MAILLRLFLALGLVAQVFAQMRAHELFDVDFSTNLLGGCQYVGEQNVNNMLVEALTLAERGIDALNDYADETRPEAKRLIDAWFKPEDLNGRQLLRDRYTQVRDWLTHGGPLIGGREFFRPQLYCHHGWIEKKQMNQQYMDNQGDPVFDINNFPVRIQDVPQMLQSRSDRAAELGLPVSSVFPYWNRRSQSFFFDRAFARGSYNTGMCSNGGIQGMTIHEPGAMAAIMLCPVSFGTSNNRPMSWEYHGLRQIPANPIAYGQVASGQVPANRQLITNMIPTVGTLFHELFHLVFGPETTNPEVVGELYYISEMLPASFRQASMNPESYACVAIAYDYTRNSEPNSYGNRVEFFSGITTQG
ncbi:hypothetical protein F4779DRAFT_622089 [Xylariaceae sp. FL0662B]|nr:hypothetical protein F4779DRAFT_622089 [Xylariaceae sp. FL0662B]